MTIDSHQFRELVTGVLKYLDPEIPFSEEAVELLMLTAATESHMGRWIKQVRGPALGVFQMEPRTEQDLWRYLDRHTDLRRKIVSLHGTMPVGSDYSLDPLHFNLAYQVAIARLHYWRKPGALPESHEVGRLADYWKKHYNTYLGKGEPAKAIEYYKRYAT